MALDSLHSDVLCLDQDGSKGVNIGLVVAVIVLSLLLCTRAAHNDDMMLHTIHACDSVKPLQHGPWPLTIAAWAICQLQHGPWHLSMFVTCLWHRHRLLRYGVLFLRGTQQGNLAGVQNFHAICWHVSHMLGVPRCHISGGRV